MSISRNTAYNLVGYLVPTLLALATVPAYLALVGAERYGVLALAWLILGYFGLFDLGLGRATQQRMAALRNGTDEQRAVALDTAMITNLGLGVVGAAVLYPAAWYLFSYNFQVSASLRGEILSAVPLLALSVPIATTNGVLSGALMGREQFLAANRISVTSTVLFQLLPLGVAWLHGPSLPELMIAALLARVLGGVMLWRACWREFGAGWGRRWDRGQLGALLAFGGWVTVASMVGPFIVFSDRFVIGSLIGAVAVTIYTVPMEAVRRLSGIALSLSNAIFPRMVVADEEQSRKLSADGMAAMYAVFTPLVSAMLFLMDPIMVLWLGTETGSQCAPLGRVFLIATWFNVFAQLPMVRLQAQGRPAVIARLFLAELPLYLAGIWLAVSGFGLWGGVWVYLGRVVVDTIALFLLAERRMPNAPLLITTLGLFCLGAAAMRDHGDLPFLWCAGLAAVAAILTLPAAAWILPEAMRRQGIGLFFRILGRGGRQ